MPPFGAAIILEASPALSMSCCHAGNIQYNTGMNNTTTTLSTNLRALGSLYEVGWQSRLAEHLDVNRSQVTRFLDGTREPSINQLGQIAEFFQVPLAELFAKK